MFSMRRAGARTRCGVLAAFAVVLSVGSMAPSSAAYVRPGGGAKQIDLLADGTQPSEGTAECGGEALSANGRFAAFVSASDGYVERDTNLGCDIFLRALTTGAIERIDVSTEGTQALGPPEVEKARLTLARNPAISRSGRYVVFVSHAINLVPGDTNLSEDIFVRDRHQGTTERVSVASDGSQAEVSLATVTALGSAGAGGPAISPNGRYIAFTHPATNLDRRATYDDISSFVFMHDRAKKMTQVVSLVNGSDVARHGQAPNISGDGRYVSFTSPRDFGVEVQYADMDMFVRDLEKDVTVLASSASDGTEGSMVGNMNDLFIAQVTGDWSAADAMSADGRYLVFASSQQNLVPNDSDRNYTSSGLVDVFVKDLMTGRIERVSVAYNGAETSRVPTHDGDVSISDDGRFIAYTSENWILAGDAPFEDGTPNVSGDPNESDRPVGFIYDRDSGSVTITARDDGGRVASDDCRPEGGDGQGLVVRPRLSAYARVVLFDACAHNLRATEEGAEPRSHYFVRFLGSVLGIGDLGRSGHSRMAASSRDPKGDVARILTEQGANLYGAWFTYRPEYEDLFVAIELEHMPKVIPGFAPTFYGLRFTVHDRAYEVRASSLLGGTFGLFDCTDSADCTEVADLQGGYGTTGERVVFSLPSEVIGFHHGGELRQVEAFSAIGSYRGGATKILDRVVLK